MRCNVPLAIMCAVQGGLIAGSMFLINKSDLTDGSQIELVELLIGCGMMLISFLASWLIAVYAIRVAARELEIGKSRIPRDVLSALASYEPEEMHRLTDHQRFLVHRVRYWFPFGVMVMTLVIVALGVSLVQLTSVDSPVMTSALVLLVPAIFLLEMRPVAMHVLALLASNDP